MQIEIANARITKEKPGAAQVSFDWKVSQGKPSFQANYRIMLELKGGKKKFAMPQILADYAGRDMKTEGRIQEPCFWINETDFEIYVIEVSAVQQNRVSNSATGKIN